MRIFGLIIPLAVFEYGVAMFEDSCYGFVLFDNFDRGARSNAKVRPVDWLPFVKAVRFDVVNIELAVEFRDVVPLSGGSFDSMVVKNFEIGSIVRFAGGFKD